MRFLTLFASFATSAFAIKLHGNFPHASNGRPLSHQLPKLNAQLTEVAIGKRRLAEEYVPSSEELDLLRRQFDDVIPAHAKRATPVKLNGVVAVFSQLKGFMGYLALNLTQYGTTPLTTDTTKVAFTGVPTAAPPAHFDLAVYNASYPFLAVIQGYSGSNWGTGNPGYGSMTVVSHSTFPASNRNNPTFLPSESNIWTLNTQTGQLTATWFNDNGTPVPCTIYYDVTYGDFGFTGDLPAYVKLYLDNTIAVNLYFVGVY